jgi:hypothetical protein
VLPVLQRPPQTYSAHEQTPRPRRFRGPASLETPRFRLRPLTIHDVVKDYDAVMSSVDHLQGVLDEDSPWPQGLTLEQDLIDLGWHQKEFQIRRSFTYTVMSPDEAQCLGCVYIFPPQTAEYEADIFMWVRTSEYLNGLDPVLYDAVSEWVRAVWPFSAVRYPGREGGL